MAQTFYFIFGVTAVNCFDEGLIREAAKQIAEGDGTLANLESGEHPGNLLTEFDGWEAWLSIEEDEYRELNELVELFKEKDNKRLDIVLLVSSGFGVYVPQTFMERYPEKFTEEQKEIIAGDPYTTEAYWDVWNEVMDFATITDDKGVQYYLYQDEDLWAIPVGYEFEDFTE